MSEDLKFFAQYLLGILQKFNNARTQLTYYYNNMSTLAVRRSREDSGQPYQVEHSALSSVGDAFPLANLHSILGYVASSISTGKLLLDIYLSGSSFSQRRRGGGLYASTLNAHGVSSIVPDLWFPFPSFLCWDYKCLNDKSTFSDRNRKYSGTNAKRRVLAMYCGLVKVQRCHIYIIVYTAINVVSGAQGVYLIMRV